MKIKCFIPGTCGRIKPDVSNVDSGVHMSLFGSTNSRKATNKRRQCTVTGNGFMCKTERK